MCDITKDSPFIYYNFIDKYKLNLFHCVHLFNSHAVPLQARCNSYKINIIFYRFNRCTISKRLEYTNFVHFAAQVSVVNIWIYSFIQFKLHSHIDSLSLKVLSLWHKYPVALLQHIVKSAGEAHA